MRASAIGGYEDWPAFTRAAPRLAGDALTTRVAGLLGVPEPRERMPAVRTVRTWSAEGVDGAELEWRTGFGPATRAWCLRPAGQGPTALPGVLGLHCHAGAKWVGAERLVGTPDPSPEAQARQAEHYGGRAVATEIAREGFVVLCHDAFVWGSRRFALDPAPGRLGADLAVHEEAWRAQGREPAPAERYDAAAAHHEHTVAKYAGALGTSLAGAVAHDDLVALEVLAGLDGVDPARLGAFGFSGGGARAAVLGALDPRLRASAIVCMMSTFEALLPAYLDAHSWLLATPGLPPALDWPDVAAARGEHDQLVLYAAEDELFPLDGMQAADALLRTRFHGAAGSYAGTFVPGRHRFDAVMQDAVAGFLVRSLSD